jgi:RNA-binding protein YhbY
MLIVEGQDAVWLKTGSNNTDWKISTVDKEALFQRLDGIDSAVEAEESRAMAAESQLQGAIDDEVSARQQAITDLQNQVNSIDSVNDQDLQNEVNRASAAETLLQSNIDAEASSRQSADNSLDSRITSLESITQGGLDQEILNRQAADIVLQSNIDAEANTRESADLALDGRLSTVESGLSQEVLDRQSGDSSTLASAQVYTDQKVADLVNSAPAVLDTLKELSDALGGDENFAATVSGQIGAVDDRVDQEILDRQAEDSLLQSAIDVEQAARIAGDQQLQSDIDAEETRALLAESGLQAQITQEVADRVADVNAEEARALAAEAALQSSLNQEISDRQDAISTLSLSFDNLDGYAQDIRSDLDQEILDREAADSALDSRLDSLEADAVTKSYVDAADNNLQSQISQEVLNRQSGDSSTLSSAQGYTDQKIADLVNSAPAVLDTLKELSDALGGDANFAATIAGQLGDLDDKIDQEILDRVADVDAEQARAEAAEALKLNKAGDTMSGDLNMGSNDVVSVDKLGLGSSAPDTKFHLEENNVKFNISAHSVSTSGAVNAVVSSIEPALDSVELFKVMIIGIDSSSKDSVSYERTVRVKNVGGTLGLGTIQSDYTSEDISMVDANCTFIVNSSNVDVRVTGIDSKDITWKCVVHRVR